MNDIDVIDGRIASTRPPAKLNLFLELLSRREDGFHELDTVMVPIDWCDQLRLQRTKKPGIELHVDWIPSRRIISDRLGITDEPESVDALLSIPNSQSNLVYKTLVAFQSRFGIPGGFRCHLHKQIPAGAGMGGASSDAAASLRCAAELCGLPARSDAMVEIASQIGSDVPFFLGPGRSSVGHPVSGQQSSEVEIHAESGGTGRSVAARATGRGERIDGIEMAATLFFVVVYPRRSLSTASVYAACVVPDAPVGSEGIVSALASGHIQQIGGNLCNRLSQPAKEIVPLIDEILESMWRSGLRACQLTGSGSACFGIAGTSTHAHRCASRLRASLQPGTLVRVARSTTVPSRVVVR